MKFKVLKHLVLVVIVNFSLVAKAQTTITNGVQKYASLTGATVTISNKCELWVTNAATPLSGCTINLNSADAWLFLSGVKPSVVASTYLGQIKISGANAVADSNCRVVQYGQNGAIVISQPSTFQPLTVYTGAEFTGTATSYSQYNYYTGAGIANISSFKLKRGYQAVFAQDIYGAKYSKCYVAQDGDLEIGVLPTTLDKQVQFIYVTPWRWTSKKGIAGDPGISRLNVNSWYNWNLDQNSSRDLEYVAIRAQRYWPGLGQDWKARGINTVLGYNEPDSSSQANILVGDAIYSWPDLLGTGLRVGSPAPTDGGRSSWLYPFITQADAAGLRVDFCAVHYYQSHNPADAAGCASQLYSFLLDVWNNTHRPIWLTEWNNGANWTDGQWPVPTYAQQQACVAAMINMLESTPFVERYQLYNWVEDGRSLVDSTGTVTPAGVTYSNLVSTIAYSQAMPDNSTRGIAQFLFNTNTWDTSGYYNNGMTIGAPTYTAGHAAPVQAIALDGTNSYVQLPANIAKGSAFTFAGWIYWNGGNNWQRIFDFGNDTTHYLFLTPSSGGSTLRFAINNGSGEQIVERAGALTSGSWQHVAVTLSNNVAVIYVNGAQVASSTAFSIAPSAFSPIKNYLGKSQFADPLFNGKLDEVEIADYAMSAAQVAVLYNGATYPTFTSSVWTNNASGNWSTSNNWNMGSIANGVSRIADFSTIDITANQAVTLDSARTNGGLKFGDTSGSQNWFLSGANTLTLDGGGGNVPTIAVNQNTATVSTPLVGAAGLAKNGGGALTINAVNTLGGGLTVKAGTINITGNSTTFGSSVSRVGYLTGSGKLALTGGNASFGGELQVAGSDSNGSQYTATGTVIVSNATLAVGSLTVSRGNYLDNSMNGTVTVGGGGTFISTNDVLIEYAGAGRGKLALSGGNFIIGPTATKWLMVGCYDSGGGELAITNSNLFLENGSSIKLCRQGNTGSNVVNQISGNVTFYSDAGTTVGGAGNLDLNYAGGATSSNTYNLNGGTLTVPRITASSASGSAVFNFNGGTVKPAASSTTFMQGLTAVNLRNLGGTIDTAGFNVTVGQLLQHSVISGDSSIDGGLKKNGNGILTLSATNTYKGNTAVNAGTLALGNTGSIATSRSIAVAAGALFDVSAVSGFTLGAAQTLSGSGTVNGAVVNNGTISPGSASGSIGTLTFNNSPTLNGVISLEVSRNNGALTNDQMMLPSSGLTYGGTLTVSSVGENLQSGDSFQLFSATSYAGSFTVTNLPALDPGLAWSNSLAANGSLAVITTVSLVPTNVDWSVSGSSLTLLWPADHTAWRLMMQINNLESGISSDTNDWMTVPNSQFTNQVVLPLDSTLPGGFFRLVYP